MKRPENHNFNYYLKLAKACVIDLIDMNQGINKEITRKTAINAIDILSDHIDQLQKYVNHLESQQSKFTNSNVFTHHWFVTIIGEHKRLGEFLAKLPNEVDPKKLKEYGDRLFETSCEMIESYNNSDQSKAHQQQWVSVEERLPDEKCAVLASWIDEEIGDIPQVWISFYTPDLGFALFSQRSALPVNYWMPLPEPPKAE